MKKRIIIPLLIFIIIVIIVTFINSKTIYLGNQTRVYSFGNKLIKRNRNNKVILKKINVYKNGNILKGYLKSAKVSNEYDYYAVSKSNNKYDLDDLIVSGTLTKIDVVLCDKSLKINDSTLLEINQLLDTNISIDSIQNYRMISKDIDNDSSKESIFYISYIDDDSISTNIFVVDNSEVTNIIDSSVSFDDLGKSYSLVGVIDFNKDKNYEVIVSRVDGDSQPMYYDIYRYENNSIKEIK